RRSERERNASGTRTRSAAEGRALTPRALLPDRRSTRDVRDRHRGAHAARGPGSRSWRVRPEAREGLGCGASLCVLAYLYVLEGSGEQRVEAVADEPDDDLLAERLGLDGLIPSVRAVTVIDLDDDREPERFDLLGGQREPLPRQRFADVPFEPSAGG